MKFSTHPQTLLEGVQYVGTVSPSRSTTPILTDLLFELQGNNLKITATDLEILVSTTVSVKGIEDGAIALPNRIIGEIIRELGEATPQTSKQVSSTTESQEDSKPEISFSTEEGYRVKILSDKGIYRIAGDPSEEFPVLSLSQSVQSFTLDPTRIQRMIDCTTFAVSHDELRPALMGVLFQIYPNELRLVATDGHRLIRISDQSFSLDFDLDQPDGIEFIVPTKSLSVLQKALSALSAEKAKRKIKMAVDKNHIFFELDNTKIYSCLVESEYPEYEEVIPKFNANRLVVNRELLYGCLRRVSIFANTLTHQVRFSLKPDRMEVTSQDFDTGGEAREILPVQYDGEEMDIGFNAVYVMEVLRHLDTEEVIFLLDTPTTAGIILPSKQKEKEDLLMLLMPVRLEDGEEEESPEDYVPPTEENSVEV